MVQLFQGLFSAKGEEKILGIHFPNGFYPSSFNYFLKGFQFFRFGNIGQGNAGCSFPFLAVVFVVVPLPTFGLPLLH